MRALALAAMIALAPAPGLATCRLGLSLALDVSSSVDAEEFAFQAGGLAAALLHPDVMEAFLSVPGQHVALHVYEWSGSRQQSLIADWSIIRGPLDLARVAKQIKNHPRSFKEFPTAIGHALGFAAVAFQQAPGCDRYVLDVSGDGANNHGFPPDRAYAHFDFLGATTNGLAIGGDPEILSYYAQEVIRGPGAFVEAAQDYADFPRAIRRKLIRELRPLEVSVHGSPWSGSGR